MAECPWSVEKKAKAKGSPVMRSGPTTLLRRLAVTGHFSAKGACLAP